MLLILISEECQINITLRKRYEKYKSFIGVKDAENYFITFLINKDISKNLSNKNCLGFRKNTPDISKQVFFKHILVRKLRFFPIRSLSFRAVIYLSSFN